ncbi:hypothetical protein [Terriglobus roseus]|uniref:CAAX protease self-immunity n=1 Tax=Terriglobus roseus TaxID=392734 RepID=A0A1G7J0K1_9BACT|nr:hypothetical protein [Terriglobus roseus]SDF18393.1 hypothetical protein SAMN05444167_1645 [Terriglobus roseus]
MPFAKHSLHKPSRPAATFLLSAAWTVLSLLSASELSQLVPVIWADFAREVIAALLMLGGFYAMARFWVPDLRPLSSLGFVRRPGIEGEFGRGIALGWGIAIALVLPALLTGNLSMQFSFDGQTLLRTLLSIAVLTAFALVVQLVLSGLPLRMLVKASSPGWAAAAVIFVVTMLAITGTASQGRTLPVMVLAASIFVVGFLRTRALWFSLGVQLGWSIVLQILFGSSSPYTPVTFGVVQSGAEGPIWFTGGPFGPEASLITVLVLIVALVGAFRLTKDYAWHYTWQPLEGAGHPMDVAPPAEHLREEKRQAAAAPLIQIGGLQTPQAPYNERSDPA